MRRITAAAVVAMVLAVAEMATAGTPLPTTRQDFALPGTQPMTITDPISTPSECTACHSGYGQSDVEPVRNWQGSMMAQAGRDPMMWAALAIANQDAPHSGETCLRCHLSKGWLEGRSVPEDGSAMTADDRQGVQCGLCHRLVDPIADPGNPAPDAAILAGLSSPVPGFFDAMMVVDPLDRLRGPFDVIGDLGFDPHAPVRSTLESPFHTSSEICGTCHNVLIPAYLRNDMTGEYEITTMDTPSPDPSKGFPEQTTYSEWLHSEYAGLGVYAPEFGINRDVVRSCQDCHMPAVTGKAANLGVTRDDLPLHTFAGANTFVPTILPFHPAFGAEVDAAALADGVVASTDMLRRAASLSGSISGGTLTVRVTNESGHKLPTGYPEARRMWLHVRALDAQRHVVLESGRYVFGTAELVGYDKLPFETDYDPNLHVWEAHNGVGPNVAAASGVAEGRSFHLVLNNVRLQDNRIPPRGFTNVAFESFDGEPVGVAYADGQHWDDVTYPVGPEAVEAEVTLYYQTTTKEYVEFLRDENTTTSAGNILFDLYDTHNPSTPVEMGKIRISSDTKRLNRCRQNVAQQTAKFRKKHAREWAKCYARRASGSICDSATRDAKIAAAEAKLRSRLGGSLDGACASEAFTPQSIGHGTSCPPPCATVRVFDLDGLASCAVCLTETLDGAALEAAYGATPPSLPGTIPGDAASCQRELDRGAISLAAGWSDALTACERDNATGRNAPPVDCTSDPKGKIARAQSKAAARIARCSSFTGLAGCATAGAGAAVQACMESTIGPITVPFARVAYP